MSHSFEMNSFVESVNYALKLIQNKSKATVDFENTSQDKSRKRKYAEAELDKVSETRISLKEKDLGESKRSDASFFPTEHNGEYVDCSSSSEVSEILESQTLSSWERNIFKDILYSLRTEKNIEESIVKSQALLHSLWQKLHTGHWSEVPILIRASFSWGTIILVGLLLLELRENLESNQDSSEFTKVSSFKLLLICDRGLMMGKPLKENPLHEVATLFNKFAVMHDDTTFDESPPPQYLGTYLPGETAPFSNITQVETGHLPSLQQFLLNYMEKNAPLKIQGLTDNWPALKTWNFKYLCKVAGARTVPVEIGRRYSDSDWSQVLMTINQYMRTCMSEQDENGKRAYLAQHQLFDQIPELLSDIIIPDYCHMGEKEPVMNAWIGPSGTVTPLHHDPDHNILVQVYGYKTIIIFPESDSEFLYPFDDVLLNNTSKVNLEEVAERKDAFDEWPLLKNVSGHYLTLGPGEALYLPPKWWHYVRSLSNSISVSFWWR